MGTCKFLFAIVSFPSTSTFTVVLFSTFVWKTGSSIETWTGITILEKNGMVEWTWKKKISIKKKGLRSSCNQTILPPMKLSPHNNCAIFDTAYTNLGLYTSHLILIWSLVTLGDNRGVCGSCGSGAAQHLLWPWVTENSNAPVIPKQKRCPRVSNDWCIAKLEFQLLRQS